MNKRLFRGFWLAVFLFSIGNTTRATAQESEVNILNNGSFEYQSQDWRTNNDFRYGFAEKQINLAKDQMSCAFLGKEDGSGDNKLSGYIEQAVSIPSQAKSAELRFFSNITSEETDPYINDSMRVELFDENGSFLKLLDASFNDLPAYVQSGTGPAFYVKKTYDLLDYKGRTITVRFTAATDNNGKPTVFRIDEVGVWARITIQR